MVVYRMWEKGSRPRNRKLDKDTAQTRVGDVSHQGLKVYLSEPTLKRNSKTASLS